MKTIENILATVTLAKSVLETCCKALWRGARRGRVANVPKKKFCGKEQVAKEEVAGGLNGFGALLVMRKLMALLGRLMIGLWLWLRLKVAAQSGNANVIPTAK